MNAHIRRVMERNKERGDVQAVAVNDIWDKRKQRAREATGVDERSVYHDYREVCASPTWTSWSSHRPITGITRRRWRRCATARMFTSRSR